MQLQDNLAVNLSAACNYRGQAQPRFGMAVEIRQGRALLSNAVWLFKAHAKLSGPVELQVRGGLQVPTPSLQYNMGDATSLQSGEFHLFVRETNLLLRL